MVGSTAQRLRWSTVEEERALALPGMTERITHPEFAGIEFVHVRAKSLLNHVPAAAGLPFEWTINVYRGCTHACTYCLVPETPVLLADGTTTPLGSLRFGDRIVGTRMVAGQRVYAQTEVRDVWRTVRRAYRVRLVDGRVLIASGDHRLLAADGWRHVGHGPARGRGPEVLASPLPAGDGSQPVGPVPAVAPRALSAGADPWPLLEADDPQVASGHPVLGEGARLLGPGPTPACADPAPTEADGHLLGRPVVGRPDARVVVVEDLGIARPMVDITTGTGDFVANGVVSHNCFARPTHEYLELDAGRDFESVIVVKVNAVERLRAELRSPRWRGEHVALGTNTDPYQRCEGRYRLTRGVVQTLSDAGNPFSLLTKGTLVTRDLDIYAEAAARRVCTGVSLSIPTLDEEVWRASEPRTPHPRARLEAVAALAEAGVPTGVMVAPIIPGLSDGRAQLEAVVAGALEAGASSITPIVLHLRPGVREVFLPWLAEVRPELVARYGRLYRGSYAPEAERRRISQLVHELVEAHGGARRRGPLRADRDARSTTAPSPQPAGAQLQLL